MPELQFPLKNDLSRKILHIDMDAFYASVEERDHPELVGKPLVIARHPKETHGRGVVTTANYLAREYGIHSAMSAKKAYELCPSANFVPGNHDYYREVSQAIHNIFHQYTDLVEPVALDEAYLDVTQNKKEIKSGIKLARMIQYQIWEELRLTCSAGVSYNKFLAKLASDYEKPRGLTVITPDQAILFLRQLPIEKFHGVGKKTVPRMHELGIFTGEDLYQKNEMWLIQEFGKMGYSLYRKVRGVDNAPVLANRERKSVGKERTFSTPLVQETDIIMTLRKLAHEVALALKKADKQGKTVVLKIRTSVFDTITRRKTLETYVSQEEVIYFYAYEIWEELNLLGTEIRLLGITLTNLVPTTYEPIVLPIK